MAQVILELTAKEQQLLQAYRSSVKADEGLRESVDKTGKSGKQAGKEIADAMIKAGKAAADGSAEQAKASAKNEREIKSYIRLLRTMGPEGKAAAKQLSDHLVRASVDGVDSIDNVIERIDGIDNAAANSVRGARQEFKKLDASQNKTVGPGGMQKVAAYGAKWLTVAGGIATVAKAIDKVRETNARALDAMEGQKDGDALLLQISKPEGEGETFSQLRDEADQLSADHGITREQARELVFSSRSEGFSGAADFIAANAQIIPQIDVQSSVAGQIPGLFTKETLTPEQAVNMTVAAAAESRLNFEELGRAAPMAAEGGSLAGASSEETLATLSALASRFKSGDVAATRIKAFATKVGLDQGVETETAEQVATKQLAEDKRVETAKRNKRSTIERVADATEARDTVAGDLAAERARKPSTRTGAESQAKRVESLERRLASAEKSLERSSRSADEFDDKQLERKIFDASQGRETLKGKGILKAVAAIESMSEEHRKEFLGNSQEVNAAYETIIEERDKIIDRQDKITAARSATGTYKSPVALRRKAAEKSPELRALKEKSKSENAREIAEEKNRAQGEARRQTGRNKVFADAERQQVPKMQIAAAEIAGDAANLFGAENYANDLAEAILGSSTVADLDARQSSLATDIGRTNGLNLMEEADKPKAKALLLAIANLKKRRRKDPDATLSPQETADYLSTAGGELVSPGNVSDRESESVTGVIDAEIAKRQEETIFTTRGRLDRNVEMSRDIFEASKFASDPEPSPGNAARADSDKAFEMADTLGRIEILLTDQNEAVKESLTANNETAKNTKPRGVDSDVALSAAANQ